ncbi:MAG TPA: carbohydrate binding domain-containing protein, partial [Verrucomicrobiota bacterium]|nr:carbohydrate binding domain-containing protein [Verrucomicrobiota bacterium]
TQWLVVIFFSLSAYLYGQESGNLLSNGGFEQGTDSWSDLWTRDKGAGKLELEKSEAHSGNSCIKIIHTGNRDWSLSSEKRLPVKFGEIYEYEGWFKVEGDGEAILCVTAYGSDGKVIDWEYGSKRTSQTTGWVNLKSKFLISKDISSIVPRIIGGRKATIYVDDLILRRSGELKPQKKLPDVLTLENKFIRLDVQTADGAFQVLDKRLNQTWKQKANNKSVIVLDANKKSQAIELSMYYAPAMMELKANIAIENDAPEFLVELLADGKMDSLIYYPCPFATEKGTYLVVPMNEGISYPVDDTSIEPMRLVSYGGHGICMGFWGVTDGDKAQMAILETADDSSIQIARVDDLLSISPVWESQKGLFGYPRRLRYSFFDNGGYVAI